MQRGVEVAKEQPWGRGAEASKLGPEASSDTIIRASIDKGVIVATSVREVLNNTGDDLTMDVQIGDCHLVFTPEKNNSAM